MKFLFKYYVLLSYVILSYINIPIQCIYSINIIEFNNKDLLGWNLTKFNNNYKNSNQVTLQDFQRLNIIEKLDRSCLTGTFNPGHSINEIYPAKSTSALQCI
jgi:hypothetical protein